MIALKNPNIVLPFIFILSLVMHIRIFNRDLVGYHVWRQTQTQINIENFYKEDFNILNPRSNDRESGSGIVRQEFPVMQWFFACLYKVFGDHLIISRILSFVIGIFSVTGIYFLLKNIFSNSAIALIGAWAFNFSPVFYYYTMNPLPDNFALCCGIWGLGFFTQWIISKSLRSIILCGIFLSLSSLAKLPFILYFIFPVTYFVVERKNSVPGFILFVFLLPALLWYGAVLPGMASNPVLLGIFSDKRMSLVEALDILQFNLISTLPELLLNYGAMLFFLSGFYFLYKQKGYTQKVFRPLLFLAIALILYFLFEMNLIAKVHDYYLFPFLPLIFITVAYGCFHLLNANRFFTRLGVFLLLILPLTAFLRANPRWNLERPGFNADLLVYKEELRHAVPDDALCVVGNDDSKNIFYYYLNKKGWAFDSDSLTAEKINKCIEQGAKYLYCDSRKADEREDIKYFLDTSLMEKGSFRVYRFKNKFAEQ